ncbi:GNAT family N-acetyltransferase [Frigidibacter sp. MR17.14]|uniref:GNAT family N-acetyltransferase n=1 Tax=Frigidibacter sp. MR17.14 TaxID=3126509 RepID=UPI003012D706
MTPPFRIRPMRPDDWPALQRLSVAARARYAAIPVLAAVAAGPPVSLARFAAGGGWVAEDKTGPLGHALTRPLDGLLYLDNISTRGAGTVRGIGTALLLRVIAAARQEGFARIALTTFRDPAWNGPWFRRFGFVPMPARDLGPGLAAVVAAQALTLDPALREVLELRLTGG